MTNGRTAKVNHRVSPWAMLHKMLPSWHQYKTLGQAQGLQYHRTFDKYQRRLFQPPSEIKSFNYTLKGEVFLKLWSARTYVTVSTFRVFSHARIILHINLKL